MAESRRARPVIDRHVRNIFKEGELLEDVVCADFTHTNQQSAIEVVGKIQDSPSRIDSILNKSSIRQV